MRIAKTVAVNSGSRVAAGHLESTATLPPPLRGGSSGSQVTPDRPGEPIGVWLVGCTECGHTWRVTPGDVVMIEWRRCLVCEGCTP